MVRGRIRRPARADWVIGLDDPRAGDPHLAGSKAAALARARRSGLHTPAGFVVTTQACATIERDGVPWMPHDVATELVSAWRSLEGPLAVRSSSCAEDGVHSSMAGRFVSVVDVRGWGAFLRALRDVIASRSGEPMAVLVQPMVASASGGVLFGVDPVTGDRRRIVLAAARGGPHAVTDGTGGGRTVLTRRGRMREHEGQEPPPGSRHRRRLARLAARAERTFGAPQDIEWAIDGAGEIWLLQSRPVTASGGRARGPVLGPGPLAETFPHPLSPLEQDLWVEPLRAGLASALRTSHAVPRRFIARSPIVAVIGGRASADLTLLGAEPKRKGPVARLDPRPGARRLAAGWRIGRLRAAMPHASEELARRTDDTLAAIPALRAMSDAALLGTLERAAGDLRALHAYEALLGMLLHPGATADTASAKGIRALVVARGSDVAPDAIAARFPEALVLLPPRIGPPVAFPLVPPIGPPKSGDPIAEAREALRLRIRWVQELGARAAWELGRRLSRRSVLSRPEDVRRIRLPDLEEAVRGGRSPRLVPSGPAGAPLPDAFRIAADGTPVSIGPGARAGVAAGGGRGAGTAHHGHGPPPPGSVLVVDALSPEHAVHLPGLAGLVSQTGSPLSHLAILARELGIPTVVGVARALERFPAGIALVVDGSTGEVTAPRREEVRA